MQETEEGARDNPKTSYPPSSIQKKASVLLALLPLSDPLGKTVLHWGMTLLAYPFFKDVASEVGRLAASQHDFSASQVYRKVKELYGDRCRVEVSAAAVLGSMKNWQVILPRRHGVYLLPGKMKLSDHKVINWLTEVALMTSNREYIQMSEIATLPYLFPFTFNINTAILDNSVFEISNHGVDKIMIGIKKRSWSG